MKQGYKKIALALMAGVMTLTMAACGGNKAPQTEANTAGTETEGNYDIVNVAYMPDYGSLSGVVAANALGYFEEEGIKINLVQFTEGPTIINAM